MPVIELAPKVTVIDPIIKTAPTDADSAVRKLRVAAYARVSTEQDEQQNSYEAQVNFYTNYILRRGDIQNS